MIRRPPPDRNIAPIALVVFLLAFVVRFVWAWRIQSPHTAVYSDMAGYFYRAEQLLGRQPPSADPRVDAFYPWGTHACIALELWLFGRKSIVGLAAFQSFVSALVPACVVFLSTRFFPTRRWQTIGAIVAGGSVALWHPQTTYAGYFMSEVWFSAALLIASLSFVRHCEGQRGSFTAGCAFAVAYVVRPQVLLTALIIGGTLIVLGVHRYGLPAPKRLHRWALVLLPFLVLAGASAMRFHKLTGRVGLISENDAIMRLFADTNVGRVEASWTTPKGTHSAWYSPGTKHPLKEENIVRFQGYVADPQILGRIREERLRGVSLRARVARWFQNVSFLAWRNLPNPEGDSQPNKVRARLQILFGRLTLTLIPLALLGIWPMLKRHAVGTVVVLAHAVTVIAVAGFFFAEARYRVPYDPFLILAATVGVLTPLRWVLERGCRR